MSRNTRDVVGYRMSKLKALCIALSTSLAAAGCGADDGPLQEDTAPLEDGPSAGKSDAFAAGGVFLLNTGGGGPAVAGATACAASGVCIAGVIIGAVVIGGITYLAFRPDRPEDAAWLQVSGTITVETDEGTFAFDAQDELFTSGPLIDYLYEGLALGDAAVPSGLDEFVATRYVDFCQGSYGGGAACVAQARDYLQCVSYAGGAACVDDTLAPGLVAVVYDWILEARRAQTVTARCSLVNAGQVAFECTGMVEGSAANCTDAKRNASGQAPRGCRTKHCRCPI